MQEENNDKKSQKSQGKPAGNTKNGWPKNQLYRWFFTFPYELMTASQLSQFLKEYCKKFTFSGERGKTGYLHWQGHFSLRTKEYYQTLKNIMPSEMHLEPTKNIFAAEKYCTKDETHMCGPYNEKTIFVKTIENLYDWQKECETTCLTSKCDRTIFWYWDKEGCKGKTQFCKYMAINHNATILQNGCFKDLAHALPDNPEIVLFNITRDLEERINYSAIEAIKDGLVFSGKYESKMKIFNSPVVMIFANFEPRKEAMSLDRWIIKQI